MFPFGTQHIDGAAMSSDMATRSALLNVPTSEQCRQSVERVKGVTPSEEQVAMRRVCQTVLNARSRSE